MALKDYTAGEREAIGRFLGDAAAWREIGMDTPAGDFEDFERLAELRRREGVAVKARQEREDELLKSYADESGRIGGRISVFVKQTARALSEPGLGKLGVYANERSFQSYLDMLRVICEQITKG